MIGELSEGRWELEREGKKKELKGDKSMHGPRQIEGHEVKRGVWVHRF